MSQIFKRIADRSLLFDYLYKTCQIPNKYFVYDLISYKRGEFNGDNQLFCDNIRQYYHESKCFYIDRKLSYSNMCTIIRQICKPNNILYTTTIIYSKSKYNINYFIYI